VTDQRARHPPAGGETAIDKPIIAVDGPAAAGKGTLARRLAQTLGLPHLDTGLLYRAVGRLVLDAGGNPDDPVVAERAARRLQASDLERADLRGPAADAASSAVAAVAGVRSALLDFQRSFAAARGAVLDGRDIGTVIFPDAPVKLFVTASPSARAQRRWRELREKGVDTDLATVEQEMRTRDERDAARDAAPMQAASDAIELDTTALDADAAFAAALRAVKERLQARASA
jgi:cytidylate kinase